MLSLTTLGLVAGVLGVAAAVPQIARMLRLRSADGVSSGTALIGILSAATWLFYGVLIADTAQIIANSAGGLLALVVLLLVARYSDVLRGPDTIGWVVQSAGWAFAVAAIYTVYGTAAVAAAAVGASLVRQVPQVRLVCSGRPLGALSPYACAVGLLAALLWTVYGVLIVDVAVIISSAVTSVLAAVVLLRRCPPRQLAAAAAAGRFGARVQQLLPDGRRARRALAAVPTSAAGSSGTDVPPTVS